MQIIFDGFAHDNGRNMDSTRERMESYALVGLKGGELYTLATIMHWKSRGTSRSGVSCSVWIGTGAQNNPYVSGHGHTAGADIADDYKRGRAFGLALQSAGVTFTDETGQAINFDGCGPDALESALEAIADFHQCEKRLIV